jgi:hypothetical protein
MAIVWAHRALAFHAYALAFLKQEQIELDEIIALLLVQRWLEAR